ncbi:hypothetical protein N5C55_22295 [Pseudomonas otitidis]|uniref:hypothetical protein n=1 Tax=Metapseudomonas otitidis TaxID=319939 RepID=UPI00244BE397|nr:hypothetical protein [Pseudomonas otitidis]MDH1108457.1 hypothetical protein [Pseudomonas otitidis]MDH1160912.1 hypothetical protein [Pseudomonas otitidis]MDH1167182.1 hypothetical protein [Pseudomonas otitidis]
MKPLYERQAPVDLEIVKALIGATPETWNSIEMHVVRTQEGEYEGLVVDIRSPEGRGDMLEPANDVIDLLYRLLDVFREGGGTLWREVFYSVFLKDDGTWGYKVKFEY